MTNKPTSDLLPVAWRYELACARRASGEYYQWVWKVSEQAPCVPDGSVRSITPLFARHTPDPAGLREALEACVFYIASPLRMSSDAAEDERRAKLLRKARLALNQDRAPKDGEGI